MKFLVVVLALASLCQAEPEADPAYFYGSYYGAHPYGYAGPYGYAAPFYRGYYARSGYGYNLPGYSYTHVDRLHKRDADADAQVLVNAPAAVAAPAFYNPYNPFIYNNGYFPLAQPAFAPLATTAPLFRTALPAVATPVATVQTVVPAFTPRDCVTAAGCQVQALRRSGLAKREAESDPEAEADPYFYATPASTLPLPLNPYYNAYNAFPHHYNTPYLNNFYGHYGHYANAFPYAHQAFPYAYAPQVVSTAVETPVEVKTEVVPEAVPAAVPATVYQTVAAAPVVHAAPVPVVHAAPAPVVRESVKPVTYTHLGAHPVHPTTVLERTQEVIY